MPHYYMSDAKLRMLQEASRLRRAAQVPKPFNTKINPIAFLNGVSFYEALIDAKYAITKKPLKILFINYDDILAAKKVRKVDFGKIKKVTVVAPKIIQTGALPHTPIEIVRPPAVYSNTSPYGIATDLHLGKVI